MKTAAIILSMVAMLISLSTVIYVGGRPIIHWVFIWLGL